MSNRIRAVFLAAASTLLVTAAGHTADRIETVPAGFNWSGFYVGAGGGFGAVNRKVGLAGLGSFNGIGGEGFFGEVSAGYDYMLTDRFLLGGFIDAHVGTIGSASMRALSTST